MYGPGYFVVFDAYNHNILLPNLEYCSIRSVSIDWFQSYLPVVFLKGLYWFFIVSLYIKI